ncbi:MAG: alpha-L-fucosidase [Fimbriimonadales bacterium]|nr:MAG: alpha-L-fucosidase [Fimbriimonadales bacterium]
MEKQRQQARERFRQMRFGLFVHWGIYSLLERGEWVMHHEKIPVSEYEPLMHRFNPVRFNADEWVQLVKQAGMRYITITAKHHDGFCMYDSALTDYKITNTPYKRDIMRELADACRSAGVALLFYYSPLDWHHPAYKSDWDAYTRYWHGQVIELVQKYRPMGIWLDGCWEKPENIDQTWKLSELYFALRRIQPGILIANNHHQKPLPDEDIQTYEQDLPGENKIGFNPEPPSESALIETCMTINNSWGYHAKDTNHKSPAQLIRILSECASRDANLLLNVGPKPDGTIQSEHQERLKEKGAWLRENGEAVYGTRGKVFDSTPWGGATRTSRRIYLHVWNTPENGELTLELPLRVKTVRLLQTGSRLQYEQRETQMTIQLPAPLPDPRNTVVVLEV